MAPESLISVRIYGFGQKIIFHMHRSLIRISKMKLQNFTYSITLRQVLKESVFWVWGGSWPNL